MLFKENQSEENPISNRRFSAIIIPPLTIVTCLYQKHQLDPEFAALAKKLNVIGRLTLQITVLREVRR